MRNLIYLFALVITAPAWGQSAEPAHHDARGGFGIQGGWNFSNFNITNNTITQAKNNTTGWLAGIHFAGWEMDRFAIRLEADYSVKGYEIANVAKVKNNYLEIPLLLKFTPLPDPIKIFIEGGASASIKLSTTVDVEGVSTTYDSSSNTWNFGLIAGAGIGFMIGADLLLSAEARYDYGLTNIANSSSVTVNTRDIQAIAGLTFLSP